jgi:hypothetical protein
MVFMAGGCGGEVSIGRRDLWTSNGIVRGTGFQRGKRGKEGEKEGTLNTKIDVKMSPLIQVRLNY